MTVLFRAVRLIEDGIFDVSVRGERIERVSPHDPAVEVQGYDRVIDGTNRLLIPGFFNTHCHAAMTLFRGYGEDMPLSRWLHERIFPAEARLRDEDVYAGALLGIAEMLRGGTVSFTDMYMHCDATLRAVAESGIKVNLSNGLVAFDPTADPEKNGDLVDFKRLFATYHGTENGRIRIDGSVHAEYTSHPGAVRAMAEAAKECGARMQIHLSETEGEHRACIERHGMTPTAYFASLGLLDCPTTAAHCVMVDEQDCAILAEKGVTVAHNPTSNLKLGSGVMPLGMLRRAGVRVSLGTDGAASNNRLDMMKEMQLAAILHKGMERRAEAFGARELFTMATRDGALAQGREDCGLIAPGMKADLALLDLSSPSMTPIYDPIYALVYAASSADVCLTMVDGRVLYENGEWTTIDIEKLRHRMRKSCERYC